MSVDRPERIVLVIATLGAGGAERVMTLLAGEWVRRGNQVTLITLGGTAQDYYEVSPGVERVGLDLLGSSKSKIDAIRRNVRRVTELRAAIRLAQPDVVISFMDSTNVLTLLATRALSVPVIVSERIDPRYYPIPGGWQWLRRKLYPRASALVVQSNAVADWAEAFVPAEKVHVVPNPVEIPNTAETQDSPTWLPAGDFIAAMGRLDRQKGFDLLLQAYADLPRPCAPLVILGEGPERQSLEQQVRELGLGDQVIMPGRVKQPWRVLSRAMLFVLSSRFEGFPNVLLEAMAAGLPVVSFDCPSGPADIISNDINGLLVPAENKIALSAAMERVLIEPALALRLGAAAANVSQTFSLKEITDRWDQIIAGAMHDSAGGKGVY